MEIKINIHIEGVVLILLICEHLTIPNLVAFTGESNVSDECDAIKLEDYLCLLGRILLNI